MRRLSFRGSARPHPRPAFEELVSAHLDALYRCALGLCGGERADAEDLLQDAMLRAFDHFRELREPEAARSWLFTILVRTNLNRLRARRRRAETFAADLEEHELEAALAAWRSTRRPDDLAERAAIREQLAAALDQLDASLRPVVWLSDVEGFRQREIARMLGIPEGTVASRLFRARRSLRDALRPVLEETTEWSQA